MTDQADKKAFLENLDNLLEAVPEDDFLAAHGYDPEAVAERMQAVAEHARKQHSGEPDARHSLSGARRRQPSRWVGAAVAATVTLVLIGFALLAGGGAAISSDPTSTSTLTSTSTSTPTPAPASGTPLPTTEQPAATVDSPTPTITPLPTQTTPPELSPPAGPPPTQQPPLVFDVSPRTIERGGTVTVTWETNASAGDVAIRAEGWDYRYSLLLADDLPPSDSVELTIPGDDKQFISVVHLSLQVDGMGSEPITVEVLCPFEPLVGDACPMEATDSASIVYQPFENGFMMAYQGKVKAFLNDGTIVNHNSPSDLTPPEGWETPAEVFMAEWLSTDVTGTAIYDRIGQPTGPAQAYTGTWQILPDLRSQFYEYVTLPDGQVVVLNYSFGVSTTWRIE